MRGTYKKRESRKKYDASLAVVIGRRAFREAREAHNEWLRCTYDNEPNEEELAKMRTKEGKYRMGGLIPYLRIPEPTWKERVVDFFRQ